MKKSIILLYFGMAMVFLFLTIVSATDEMNQIKQSISKKGANWTAGENWVTMLSPEERRKLCGAILEPPEGLKGKMLTLPMNESLPAHLDWRDNNGNWITPVKHQSSPQSCGSCWDFAAVAAVESWWKIHNSNVDSMIDLSEQFILSCGDAGSCDGGSPSLALDFVTKTGIPSEECFYYQANDQIPCSNACDNWQEEAVKIPGWGLITGEEPITENIKNAVFHHPVSACFDVYEDFPYYSGGIYEHVWGNFLGGHCILIVGWNDAEQSWICKNSWNTDWGDNGYFRIKWGNCQIGRWSPFIWDEMTGEAAFVVSPQQMDLSLTVGDSITNNVTVYNQSSTTLHYSAWGYETPINTYFHADSFNSYQGASWWCGDPQLCGYGNTWLQYLDLPALDLTQTQNPELSWMGYWALEDTAGAGALPLFDGWDGCNVWISVDGGKSFSVAYPDTPAYICNYLYSFSSAANLQNIAGWGGSSDGWIPVHFDLSAYKTDSIIIRFAFASDEGVSTLNDPTLYGFFVDDIVVADDGSILFENHGEEDPTLVKNGYAGMDTADWLDISGDMGTVSPYDSTAFYFSINSRNLSAERHQGLIWFSSNDSTISGFTSSGKVSVQIDLQLPQYDLAVQNAGYSDKEIPVSMYHNMQGRLENCGQQDFSGCDVVCMVLDEDQTVYCDGVHIPSLAADSSLIVTFEPFVAWHVNKTYQCVMNVINAANEYNSYNNVVRSKLRTTNLISGFEQDAHMWNFEGGWGFCSEFYQKGKFSAHVNGCDRPYLNNMNTYMTLKLPIELSQLDAALVKYQTIFKTELNKDICYVEMSGDKSNWIQVDSLSGDHASNWEIREIELDPLIKEKHNQAWIRFHFISDSINTDYGVYIDQLEIYPTLTDIPDDQLTAAIPDQFILQQNYPNPFNPKTVISYQLPTLSQVELSIYNILGQKVATLVSEKQPIGMYKVEWDASAYSSGIYLYKLTTDNGFSKTKKLVLLK